MELKFEAVLLIFFHFPALFLREAGLWEEEEEAPLRGRLKPSESTFQTRKTISSTGGTEMVTARGLIFRSRRLLVAAALAFKPFLMLLLARLMQALTKLKESCWQE